MGSDLNICLLDVRRTIIEGRAYEEIAKHARRAQIGGVSHLRDQTERKDFLIEDQLVGQLGEYALCRFFSDTAYYFARRTEIDENPTQGDSGFDYKDIDIKTSKWRNIGRDAMKYHLWVREREYSSEKRYVLALARILRLRTWEVWLIGWAFGNELSLDDEGRYDRIAYELHPIKELK